MKITIGEWKTRDGRKAVVAAENPSAGPYSRFIGWVDGCPFSWDSDGFYIPFDAEHVKDLIAPWADPVPWDWSTTPPWINWIAMDQDGDWYLYDAEPEENLDAWCACGKSSHEIPKSHSPKWSGDWKLSKTMRPKEVAK